MGAKPWQFSLARALTVFTAVALLAWVLGFFRESLQLLIPSGYRNRAFIEDLERADTIICDLKPIDDTFIGWKKAESDDSSESRQNEAQRKLISER